EASDPFALVADELSILANRLRKMVVAEVPKLASAAEYFFKLGVEGKRFRPTVLLLMASAIDMPAHAMAGLSTDGGPSTMPSSSNDLRARQQCIAEITEMIH
ncbi:solanesyl-diphosphate synthase 1, mitochondrial-like, partial [Phalaenopsis equestris]